VLRGVYVDDVLGAYVVKENERFERTVRVLKCEGNGQSCTGIAGRSEDGHQALCGACDPLTVPTCLLRAAKGDQVKRADSRGEVAADFHDRISPQALHDKWSADKECAHCGRTTVLGTDVELYSALSMDREEGPNANYMDPEISCWPCNLMMRTYEKAVVTYALATGNTPMHEDQRVDFMAYQVARLNHNRKDDLKKAKYRALPNWESLKEELAVKATPADLQIPEVDERFELRSKRKKAKLFYADGPEVPQLRSGEQPSAPLLRSRRQRPAACYVESPAAAGVHEPLQEHDPGPRLQDPHRGLPGA
jgi:hypothetical protein